MIAVLLDNHRIGAGPATVLARVDSVKEYLYLAGDRDGARNPRMRLWATDYPVGARVKMVRLVSGTGRGEFALAESE